MEIRKVPVEKIKPAAFNPRIDLQPGDKAYEDLKRSIDEFDCVEPLVWNKKTGNLIGGHQRLKILKTRGDKEIEVVVVDLDERQERLLNIALNKIQGDWEFTKLADMLQEIDTGENDLDLTGFDISEMEAIATWTPESVPKLQDIEIEGGSKQQKFLLVFSFDSEEELKDAQNLLGLDPKTKVYDKTAFEKALSKTEK